MAAKFKVGDRFSRYGGSFVFTVESVEEYRPEGHRNWDRSPVVTYKYHGKLSSTAHEALELSLSEESLSDNYKLEKQSASEDQLNETYRDQRRRLKQEAEALINLAEGVTQGIAVGSRWAHKQSGIVMTVEAKSGPSYICRWRGGYEKVYSASIIRQRYNQVSGPVITEEVPPPSSMVAEVLREENEQRLRDWAEAQERRRIEAEQALLQEAALKAAKEQELREERERKAREIDKIMHPERYRERIINI